MLKYLPIFILLALSIPSQGQITVTNSIFFQSGDVVYTSQDTATPGVIITPPGPNQTWVFDNFIPPAAETIEVLDASDGTVFTDFPDANIIIPQFGGEGYTQNTGDSLVVIGFYGDAGLGFGGNLSIPLVPPMVVTQTPLVYGNAYEDSFGFNATIDPADFPGLQTVLDSLLPAFIQIDSIRINYTSTRYDTLDAWGSLTTNHGTFDVLRQKRLEYTNTEIETLIPLLGGWINPSSIPGVPSIPFAGPDTTLTYDFINDVAKIQIMSVTMASDDEEEVQSVNYKVAQSEVVPPSSLFDPKVPSSAINAFPNPAFEVVQFELKGLPSGEYEVSLHNVIGRQLRADLVSLQGDISHEMSLKGLGKGVYFYSLKDENGAVLITKRLVVLGE